MTKNTTTDIEKFQYNHIFNLIFAIFKFNEKKYGNFVKDVIGILLEFEKNGETIIDVDNSLIIFELLEDCLLYTSPSPRDSTLSRMPSSA